MEDIYADISARTGGNIYLGVVGPVRTGKSTLIKRIMEVLVIPGISDPYRAERARDELPQCGSGKTIMTSEPKFVPEEAVEICPDGSATLRVRMIDSVGYMVEGATGAEENGEPRMVTTPWYDTEIPMTQAAELGTKKVMDQHCTIGLVVTSDGTVTDIPRQDYMRAEEKAIADMKATGKPFLVIINSREPNGKAALAVKKEVSKANDVTPVVMDCQALDEEGIKCLLKALLSSFPMSELRVNLPRWMDALEADHPVKATLYHFLFEKAAQINNLGQAEDILSSFSQMEQIEKYDLQSVDYGKGIVSCAIQFPESLFFEILSSKAGLEINNDMQLLKTLSELSVMKKEYEKITDALTAVKSTGYGVVMPTADELTLETPEVIRKSGAYGVKLKAKASSIHMIRVDIDTEISPMVGDEKQSQELIQYLHGEDADSLWKSNIFGKSVYDLIQEGINTKLLGLPHEVRGKFQGTLTRIVNEGATGLICLIL